MKRGLKWLGILLVLLILGIGLLFKDDLLTLATVKKINDKPFYKMNYQGDYALDELLQKGVRSDQELAKFAAKKLLKGMPVQVNVPNLGCTTFNAQTPSGDHLFARNYDLDNGPAMIVKTKPAHGYQSISMVDPSLVGVEADNINRPMSKALELVAPYIPLDGMNEEGLSVGVLRLADQPTKQDTGKKGVTTTIALRMLLDKAKNVDEAVRLLKQYDMNSSARSAFHFQIADRSGKSIVVEYVDNQMKILPMDKKYQVLTNFYLSPEKYNQGGGQDRYAIADHALAEKQGVMSMPEAMQTLQAAQSNKKYPDGRPLVTQWSSVYNQKTLQMDVAVDRNYGKIYHFNVK